MSVLYSEKFAYSFYCSTSAAAGTSMPLARILDTAITAVSFFVIWIADRLLADG